MALLKGSVSESPPLSSSSVETDKCILGLAPSLIIFSWSYGDISPHDDGISMLFVKFYAEYQYLSFRVSSMLGLSFYAWSLFTGLGFLVPPTSCDAGCPLWDVGQYAVGTLPLPPPSSPLPSLEQPMGTLASSALVQCHHQGWVGWDGVESKKMGWVRIWVWGDGWLNGWVGGWAVASDGHCREGRSFPNV